MNVAGVSESEALQGASLMPILRGATPEDWREYHYYHYYEYPGWHMVQRHEGIYDGRYKLIHFYDLDEWEFLDMLTDPNELTNQFNNPDYLSIRERLSVTLEQAKLRYAVPTGIPAKREGVDPMQYYSTQRLSIEQDDR